ELLKHFGAVTSGFTELKLNRNRRDEFLAKALHPTARSYRDHLLATRTGFATANVVGYLLFFAVTGLLLFGARHLNEISPQVLLGLALTILFRMSPFADLMSSIEPLSRASVPLKKLHELCAVLQTNADAALSSAGAAEPVTSWSELELRGISHARAAERDDK